MARAQQLRRERVILAQRCSGLTLKEIAGRHGISVNRARQILLRAQARSQRLRVDPATVASLGTRARNVLLNLGLSLESKRAEVARRLPDLRRGAGTGPGSIRNFGESTLSEIERWVRR